MEWDWPATKHRRPRVLEPEESIRARFDVVVTRQRRPSWIVPAAIIVAVLLLWRFKLGVFMLAVLVGWQTIAAFVFAGAIIGLLAWRDRLSGRHLGRR
jgi:hypothetical protein